MQHPSLPPGEYHLVRNAHYRIWNLGARATLFRQFNTDWRKAVGNLLHYAVVFLVVALIAAALGFGGVAGTAMEGARILFWVAIILFVISLIGGLVRRGSPRL